MILAIWFISDFLVVCNLIASTTCNAAFRNIVYWLYRPYISAYGVLLEQAVDYILRELQRLLLKKRE